MNESVRVLTRGVAGMATLRAALDDLGVEIGDPFLVCTEEALLSSRVRARRSDPNTSHAAAESVEDVRRSQRAVHQLLARTMGLTDAELVRRYEQSHTELRLPKQSESGLRTRRRELADAGLVYDTGLKRKTPAGRSAIVWAVARTDGEGKLF